MSRAAPASSSAAERTAQRLALVSEVNQRIATLMSAGSALQPVLETVRQRFDYYHASMFLLDGDQSLTPVAGVGRGAGELMAGQGDFLQQRRGLVWWVVQSGAPLVVNDVTGDERFLAVDFLPDTRSELVVPMRAGGRIVGAMDIQSDVVGAFNQEDLAMVQIVADQVAIALENNRLLETERAERARVETLDQAGRIISSSLEIERVLDLILEELSRVVRYDGVRLKIVEGDTARVIACRGFKDHQAVMGTSYRVSRNHLATLIVRDRQVIRIPNVGEDPRWLWLPGTHTICAWIGLPLIAKDRVIGLLSVNRLDCEPFTETDARIVQSFANQAAIALENARLFDELKTVSEELETRVADRTAQLSRARDELSVLLNRLVEIQENERSRIANELHDGLIQSLSAVNYMLQSVKLSMGDPQGSETGRLGEIQAMLDEMVQNAERIVHDLRPLALANLGLVGALRQMAQQYRESTGLRTEFAVLGQALDLPPGAGRTVYRIVQESLTNAHRHSGAKQVRISLVFRPDVLETRVQDDGRGFEPLAMGQGMGLLSMEERARSSGGALRVHSRPGRGTTVELKVPLEARERPTEGTRPTTPWWERRFGVGWRLAEGLRWSLGVPSRGSKAKGEPVSRRGPGAQGHSS